MISFNVNCLSHINLSRPAILHHLKVLKQSGFILPVAINCRPDLVKPYAAFTKQIVDMFMV
ncbi:ArsR family transcriptional regulator [Paenibacillus sp. S28]|uniref:ArsR family transcriptional regulator n=1 Tax=Paenibacillus sp. S28 TaxID=2767463 RepID=UPI00190E36E4|nr:ArsR family transcriptional regulator [Paenibacillus sp. S28]